MVICLKEYAYIIGDSEKILYEVMSKKDGFATLRGVYFRKKIIVRESEIEKTIKNKKDDTLIECNKFKTRVQKESKNILGTVLHIDSDKEYIEKCLKLYKDVGVYCYPLLIEERDLKRKIKNTELSFIPDVIVITGHDVFNDKNKKDLSNYKNSKYYMEGVLVAREKYPNAVIISGACQSHYEALIASGANFASSPERINIHVYDPAIIAIAVCSTNCVHVVDFLGLKKYIEKASSAFGGIKTKGKMKTMY